MRDKLIGCEKVSLHQAASGTFTMNSVCGLTIQELPILFESIRTLHIVVTTIKADSLARGQIDISLYPWPLLSRCSEIVKLGAVTMICCEINRLVTRVSLAVRLLPGSSLSLSATQLKFARLYRLARSTMAF